MQQDSLVHGQLSSFIQFFINMALSKICRRQSIYPSLESAKFKVTRDRLRLSVCTYEEYARSATTDTETARNIYEQAP